MSENRLPPPDREACLVRLRASTQKGGTLIAEDVNDLATHERRICDPDGYRPESCPSCHATRLHIHDYRERTLREDPEQPATTTVRIECVGCGAIWHVLPAFIARHLWRSWRVVEHALMSDTSGTAGVGWRWPTVPARTVRRWRARWQRPAHALGQVLATSGRAAWAALARLLRPEATCGDLVAAYAGLNGRSPHAVAGLAALVYRLQPRVRLM